MAGNYTATYGTGDISKIVIDGLATFFIAVIAFASIIALVWAYRWFKKSM